MMPPLIPLMVYGIAVAALLGLAAWGAERLLTLLRWPVRWLWVTALAGSIGLLAIRAGEQRPAEAAPAPAIVGELTSARILTIQELSALFEAKAPADGFERTGGMLALLPPLPAGDPRVILILWALLVVTGVTVIGHAALSIHRQRNRWPRRRVEGRVVRVSSEMGPAAVGVLRPEVLLPSWALALERRLLRLILRHEEEHVAAGDTRLLAGGLIAVLLIPWNPVFWWLLRRLRLAVELDCDRRVLPPGMDTTSYARALLTVGGHRVSRIPFPSALFEPGTQLERRLQMLIGRTTRKTIALGIAGCVIGAAALFVACESEVPTAARSGVDEAEAAEVQSVSTGSVSLQVEEQRRPMFIVDGIILEEFDRDLLESIDILGVEVISGATGEELYGERARNGVISLTTSREGEIRAGSTIIRYREDGEPVRVTIAETSFDALPDAVRGDEPELEDLTVTGVTSPTEGIKVPFTVHELGGGDAEPEVVLGRSSKRLMDVPVQELPDAERRAVITGKIAGAYVVRGSGRADGNRIELRTPSASLTDGRTAPEVELRSPQSLPLRRDASGEDDPMYIVDGVILSGRLSAERLKGMEIEGVEVISGSDALALYGERARNGVVAITTSGRQSTTGDRPIRGGGDAETDGPLFIVDGVIVSDFDAGDLDTREIENVEVISGASGAELYGERARNGVIGITTNRGAWIGGGGGEGGGS